MCFYSTTYFLQRVQNAWHCSVVKCLLLLSTVHLTCTKRVLRLCSRVIDDHYSVMAQYFSGQSKARMWLIEQRPLKWLTLI